jgi:hypothetical protein
MLAEECLECIHASLPELVQNVARLVPHPPFPFYLPLRASQEKGYIQPPEPPVFKK